EYWLNLYNSYCITEAENATPKKSKVSELRTLYEKYPISELKKKNWFPKTNDTAILKSYVKKYNLDNIPPKFAARTGNLPNRDELLRNTWVNIAEYGASSLKLKPYRKGGLAAIAKRLPKYTLESDGMEKIIDDLKNCGVGFFTLTHLPKTYLDGAVFAYENNPIIVYTHRYDRTDNFWFTLAHEIAHVLLHYKNSTLCILDNFDNKFETKIENEADELAKIILKNHELLNFMYEMKYKDIDLESKIDYCSKEIGICKSLIAGMYQFEFKSFYRNKILNNMKKKITDLLPKKHNLDERLIKEAELV
ncbi:MAG: ImmA/IrrE family metallo-endopeptidase, partial [Candidatus Delongbacteria bacterium]|nr:ImmA/IrrE family metallo-endopeptidase [Candidatus Delongbacteria bacterium]